MQLIKAFSLILLLFFLSKTIAKDPFALPAIPQPTLTPIHLQHITSHAATHYLERLKPSIFVTGEYLIDAAAQNTLWIYVSTQKSIIIKHLIRALDNPTPRILIRAKIMMLDQHCLQELGAVFAEHDPTNSSGGFTLPLINLNNQRVLDIKLHALEANGHANVISNPSLVVNTGNTASIASGQELPYQEQTNEGNTSVVFKNALLELKVTPTLLADHNINLVLSLHQDKPSDRLINGTPAVETEQILTNTNVAAHQTLVLGGIYEQSRDINHSGIPGLSRIPLLGALFESHHSEQKQRLLVIFITPSLV